MPQSMGWKSGAALLWVLILGGCATTEPSQTYYRVPGLLPVRSVSEGFRTDAAEVNQLNTEAKKACEEKFQHRQSDSTTSRHLKIAGLALGGAGLAGSGIGAAVSNSDVKTGLAIGAAVTSAAVATISGVQLLFEPASDAYVIEIGQAQGNAAAALGALDAAESERAVAHKALDEQKGIVRTAEAALDQSRQDYAKSPTDANSALVKLREGILERENARLAKAQERSDLADKGYPAAKKTAIDVLTALKEKCVKLD
jgi:hypothetical protein